MRTRVKNDKMYYTNDFNLNVELDQSTNNKGIECPNYPYVKHFAKNNIFLMDDKVLKCYNTKNN